MRMIRNITDSTTYGLSQGNLPDHHFFLTIDTTGLVPEESHISMIGGGYFLDGSFHSISWLNESGLEEKDVLLSFCALMKDLGITTLVTYYGRYFALPFMTVRAKACDLETEFASILSLSHIDLYKTARTYRKVFGLTSCRQKKMEAYLGIHRTSTLSGKELIKAYQMFVGLNRAGVREHFSKELLEERDRLYEAITSHNKEQICILARLSALLILDGLRQGIIADADRVDAQTFTFRVEGAFPRPLMFENQGMRVTFDGVSGRLTVPVYMASEGDYLYKHPYKQVSDYYYLPKEDRAIHKSLAAFVPRGQKEKATADTCYEWLSIDHDSFYTPEGLRMFVSDCIAYVIRKY